MHCIGSVSVVQIEKRHAFVEDLIGLECLDDEKGCIGLVEKKGRNNMWFYVILFTGLTILLSGLEAATFYLFNYKVQITYLL